MTARFRHDASVRSVLRAEVDTPKEEGVEVKSCVLGKQNASGVFSTVMRYEYICMIADQGTPYTYMYDRKTVRPP